MPLRALPALAEVRALPGVEVCVHGVWAWVRWQAGEEHVLRRVLPVANLELYEFREARWYPHDGYLPTFDVPPVEGFRPLHQVLFPAATQPLPTASSRAWEPVDLVLVADHRPRPATALECAAPELERWADGAPTARVASLQAAFCQGRVLLRGRRLPPLPHSERYWGQSVHVPLGLRPEPSLPEAALRNAFGVAPEEILLFKEDHIEVIPCSVLQPLTRGSLRLAGGGAP
jgi:hypothetical protein